VEVAEGPFLLGGGTLVSDSMTTEWDYFELWSRLLVVRRLVKLKALGGLQRIWGGLKKIIRLSKHKYRTVLYI
jgi:hypothetical protein